MVKNTAIKASIAATREKRKTQTCKVFTLKLTGNKQSAAQEEALTRLFLEAKWLYNHLLAGGELGTTVQVKTPSGLETRELTRIGSQMRQSIEAQLALNKRNLAAKKKAGYKIGALRFQSTAKAVNLKQYGATYRIQGSRVKLQNLPGWYRVKGVHQLEGWELANAKLLKKPDGHYLAVTAYKAKTELPKNFQPGTVIGLDMGLKTHITLSDGREVNARVKETKRLKRLQQRLARQVMGSNSRAKTLQLIQKEYQKVTNRKDDLANKVAHEILQNQTVFMQDEQLAAWKKRDGYVRGGRVVQHSILGRVKAKLAASDQVVVLHKRLATTQHCICGAKNKHQLDQRVYFCSQCGYTAPRDLHAAMNMVWLGQDRVPVGRRDFKPVERESDWETNLLAFQHRAVKPEASGLFMPGSSRPLAGEASGSSAQM